MNERSGGGLGICGVALVVLVILKLTDNLDWSWWLVIGLPMLPAAVLIASLLFGFMTIGVEASAKRGWNKKQARKWEKIEDGLEDGDEQCQQ